MKLELTYQNFGLRKRRVQVILEYEAITEILAKNPEKLLDIIRGEKTKSEILIGIKDLDA